MTAATQAPRIQRPRTNWGETVDIVNLAEGLGIPLLPVQDEAQAAQAVG